MRFRLSLAILCILATAGIASQATGQTARDSAIAKQAKVATDSLASSVAPALKQYCATRGATGYVKTACPIFTRQLTAIQRAESALVASAVIVVPPPPPPPLDTTYHVFAASDFEHDTLGAIGGAIASPFWNPYHSNYGTNTRLAVADDPTHTGHGHVLSIHYMNYPFGAAPNYDDNDAIETNWDDPATHATNGDEVVFDGDFYLPRSKQTDTINTYGLRKLNYWCSAPGTSHACLVLSTQPSQTSDVPNATTPPADEQLQLTLVTQGPSALPCDCPYYGVKVTSEAWHHLTIEMRFNSTNAAKDGRIRIVFDGQVITDRSDVQFVDPASTTPIDWYDWRVGEQVNSSRQIDEYRYWDNLRFTIKRAKPLALARARTLTRPLTFPKSFEGPPWLPTKPASTTRIPIKKP